MDSMIITELSLTDPAFMFPGISLLFLAYTNRYLALANIVRHLSELRAGDRQENRQDQLANLKLRITVIKYMQLLGVVAFLFCVATMISLFFTLQTEASILFLCSLVAMFLSLCAASFEILQSGKTLDMELERTRPVQD